MGSGGLTGDGHSKGKNTGAETSRVFGEQQRVSFCCEERAGLQAE